MRGMPDYCWRLMLRPKAVMWLYRTHTLPRETTQVGVFPANPWITSQRPKPEPTLAPGHATGGGLLDSQRWPRVARWLRLQQAQLYNPEVTPGSRERCQVLSQLP